ncbi:MAG TPA: Hsp20/alpha crystallin family protein [Candidatus Binataceae bacterium]|nr:Hsp20/alpha crystallin family protein [Candidatus Binataceae bacterium]
MTPEQEIATREKQQVEGAEKTRPGRYFRPDVDICEFEDMLRLWADMPGVSEKDVDVTLHDGALTISGTVSAGAYAGLSPLYTEYNVGNYYREFALNEDVDESRIKARMRNGVLEVELPKRERAKPRKIQIESK